MFNLQPVPLAAHHAVFGGICKQFGLICIAHIYTCRL